MSPRTKGRAVQSPSSLLTSKVKHQILRRQPAKVQSNVNNISEGMKYRLLHTFAGAASINDRCHIDVLPYDYKGLKVVHDKSRVRRGHSAVIGLETCLGLRWL